MSDRRHDHARYRELISDGLDGTLSPGDAAALASHLGECGRCRATERAYRGQRQALRAASRPITPPRDLWARTSAALDREVARQGGYAEARIDRRAVLGGMVAVATVASLGLSVNLLTTQPADVERAVTASGEPLVVRATPFAVPPEALAFLGSGAEGLTVYSTRVDRVCPAAAIDCIDYQPNAPAVVALPQRLQPRNLALSPSGGRLAIEGREQGGEEVIAVAVIAPDELARQPRSMGGAAPTAGSTASATPFDGALASTTPAALHATPALPSADTATPDVETAPMATATAAATADAAVTGSPAIVAGSPAPSLPGDEAVISILDDVRTAGAPAAWSADGSALAFSAMPADLSHGPDVYIWRPGDDRAQALTSDHGSYFASWVGSRVVLSRVARDDSAPPEGGPPASEEQPSVKTVVIDTLTGEERIADGGAGLWLPAINPGGTHAVGWHGSITWTDTGVEPHEGGLYLADWTLMDPFAEHADDDGTEETAPDAATPAAEDEGGARPPTTVRLQAVGPTGADDERNVRDWQIRWSADGQVMGYWIADVPDASWGQLTVVRLDPATGRLVHDEPLLRPTLARRAFMVGLNRVAWVAPADEHPEGELRIRTWGPDGFGDLRVRPPAQAVPAS